MDKHYYKVNKETHRGRCICELIEKGKKMAQATEKLALELGADSYTDRPGTLFPGMGIGSLIFKRMPNLWKYQSIGQGEYIPNMKTEEGKEIAKRISKLPELSADDYRIAFGIPINKSKTPAWFMYGKFFYLCSTYTLGEEYTAIVEQEFLNKMKKVK